MFGFFRKPFLSKDEAQRLANAASQKIPKCRGKLYFHRTSSIYVMHIQWAWDVILRDCGTRVIVIRSEVDCFEAVLGSEEHYSCVSDLLNFVLQLAFARYMIYANRKEKTNHELLIWKKRRIRSYRTDENNNKFSPYGEKVKVI